MTEGPGPRSVVTTPYLYSLKYSEERMHLGHAKHLCNLAQQGIELFEYKKYVKNPKYICKKCGRVAAKEENLCEPVKL